MLRRVLGARDRDVPFRSSGENANKGLLDLELSRGNSQAFVADTNFCFDLKKEEAITVRIGIPNPCIIELSFPKSKRRLLTH